MADHAKIRALIAEIAATHGVALSPDDPLLILQTINTMLLAESADALIELSAAIRTLNALDEYAASRAAYPDLAEQALDLARS